MAQRRKSRTREDRLSEIQPSLFSDRNESPWRSFKEAREFVHNLRLKDKKDWEDYIRGKKTEKESLPGDIPPDPEKIYHHTGWKSWDDWLGKGHPKPGKGRKERSFTQTLWQARGETKWLRYEEARDFVWQFGFEYKEEWDAYIKGKFPHRQPLPENIPRNPDSVYRWSGWSGWKDWLVPPDKRTEYTPFYPARDFVRSLRLGSRTQWEEYIASEDPVADEYSIKLPRRPHLEYADSGWEDWEDWLGTWIKFRDFATTRKFIHSLKLKNRSEWYAFCRNELKNKPTCKDNIYRYPEIAYSNEGWKGWEDWLGSNL